MLITHIIQIVMMSLMTSLEVKRSPILRAGENLGLPAHTLFFVAICKELEDNKIVQKCSGDIKEVFDIMKVHIYLVDFMLTPCV